MKTRPPSPEHRRDVTPVDAPPGWRPPAQSEHTALRGRGTAENPTGRFERLHHVEDLEARERARLDAEGLSTKGLSAKGLSTNGLGEGITRGRLPRTQYLRDASRSVLVRNNSPDVGFDVGLNPYRGCEHGCVYCYARPSHEFLGMSPGLDFETRILIKEDAPALLERELSKPRYRAEVIGMSGVTDCYQPVERVLRLTRGCLEVLAECRHPVGLITKNALITRDVDLLAELARWNAATVHVSMTTLDGSLHRVMEPRASHPTQRLRAIEALARAGVPVAVLVGPVIPGLTDHEIPAILEAAASAGAGSASHILLRLPGAVEQLFPAWLERYFPERRTRVLSRLREIRSGELNDPRFGSRMRGEGAYAEQIHGLFELACRKSGLDGKLPEPTAEHFRRPQHPERGQFELFDPPDQHHQAFG